MTDLMFFSLHNTDSWWQYLAQHLNFTKSTCIVSDVRGDGTINIVDKSYTTIRQNDCASLAIQQFSDEGCKDIIRRCRVLRNIKKKRALTMIGAMWLTFDELIQEQKPKLVISFIIDRYVLDVLNRVLQTYNIPFLEMTASIIPDHVMFMMRGKLVKLREPEQHEIEKARHELINETFTPSYVSKNKKYTRLQYWRTFLYFRLRGMAFRFIRYLKRDKLNLHYLDALNSLDHKPSWFDFKVFHYLNKNWGDRLQATPRDKRVFLALQLLPEASLDYWLNDLTLLDNDEIILEICRVLSHAGYTLFVKDHPLQFGFRQRALMQKLATTSNVVIIPYEAPATYFIRECPITVTFTGTIGFQSALTGACSIVSGAYYSDDKHFVHFHNRSDIALLPEKIVAFQKHSAAKMSDEAIDGLLTQLLSASVLGDLFSFKGFNKEERKHQEKTALLIKSLNAYLSKQLTIT